MSARFGAGTVLRDFQTPVPRVLLFATLAGPAPSGSASTPGVVRAAPALPSASRIGLPSATPPCCDRDSGGGLSPPLESTAPHGAPGGTRTSSSTPAPPAPYRSKRSRWWRPHRAGPARHLLPGQSL